MIGPTCPSCNVEMVQKRSKHGLFWSCPNWPDCDVAIGAHQETGEPLGTPVTKAEREWRIKAHDEFDKLWKDGSLSRSEAYHWLTKSMRLGKQAHIGEMDVTQCRQVIGLCKLTPPKGGKK